MVEKTEQANDAELDPASHVVLVPEHLREQVEERVRQLVEEEDDVSGYMGIKLVIKPVTPNKCELPTGPVYCTASCIGKNSYDMQLDSSA